MILWPIAMQSRYYLVIAYRPSFGHILSLQAVDVEKLVLVASLFI